MSEATAETHDIDTNPPELFLRTIEHDITDEENSLKKNDLVALELKLDSVRLDKAKRASDFNAEIKQLNNQRSALLGTIQTGREKREVQCYEVADERRGIMAIIRNDTKEVVDERALTLDERQGKFPFEDVRGRQANDDDEPAGADAAGSDTPPPPADGPAEGGTDEAASEQKAAGGAGKVTRIRASDVKKKKAERDRKAKQAAAAGEDELA